MTTATVQQGDGPKGKVGHIEDIDGATLLAAIEKSKLEVMTESRQNAEVAMRTAIQTVRAELGGAVQVHIAKAFRDAKMFDIAAQVEGKPEPTEGYFDVVWNKPLRAKHIFIAFGVAGACWLIYEGVAYLLRNTIPLPRAFGGGSAA